MKEIYPIIQKLIETLEERKELSSSNTAILVYIIVLDIIKHTIKNINEDDIIISKSEYIKLLYLEKHHLQNNYNKGEILEIKEILKEIEELNEKIEYLKL